MPLASESKETLFKSKLPEPSWVGMVILQHPWYLQSIWMHSELPQADNRLLNLLP